MSICIECNRDHLKNINNPNYDESNKCPKCRGFISYLEKEDNEYIKCDCCQVEFTFAEFNQL